MDAVLVCGFFIALALAAPRWGYDSRRYPRSREEELAAHGMSWPGRCAKEWDAAWWERAWQLSAAAEAAQRAQQSAHGRRRARAGSARFQWAMRFLDWALLPHRGVPR